jgi:hypothetical protein
MLCEYFLGMALPSPHPAIRLYDKHTRLALPSPSPASARMVP